MTRRTAWLGILCVVAVGAGGCKHEFEPPDEGARVREAEAAYSRAAFDTVAWASDSVRALDGNTVYAEKCRRCHGPLGLGQTDYARERRLQIPSLAQPEWRYADLDSLRHLVFVGHEGGMPGYGAGGISLRQIDGVSYYILEVLRPDAGVAGS